MAIDKGVSPVRGVLVTGSGGFIGSALVRHLQGAGVPVNAAAHRRSDELSAIFGAKVWELDVLGELTEADGAFNSADTLVHCATPNDIASKAADGGLNLGVTGTYRLIEHAVQLGIRRVVFLSTLQVYGTELNGVISEHTPVRCESAYGLNHFLGEEVCRNAAARHGIDVVLLRPSNVYGVPEVSTVNRRTLVPFCFIDEAARGGVIELKSSGQQTRNFVSTSEVAEVIGKLIAGFPVGVTTVNAVSAWNASILEIAQLVQGAWQRHRDERIEIRVMSDQPSIGNQFSVKSWIGASSRTAEQSKEHFTDVIDGLIRQLS